MDEANNKVWRVEGKRMKLINTTSGEVLANYPLSNLRSQTVREYWFDQLRKEPWVTTQIERGLISVIREVVAARLEKREIDTLVEAWLGEE